MRPDQERVRNLLIDTVTLLCKNSLQFKEELHVEGLLGVSVDKKDVFFVHISKEFTNSPSEGATVTQETDADEDSRHAQGSMLKDSDKHIEDSNIPQDQVKVKTEVSEAEDECSIVEDPNIKLEGVASPAHMVAGQRRAFKRTSQSHISGTSGQCEQQYSGDDNSNLSGGYNLGDGGLDASQYGHLGEPPNKRRNDSQDGYGEDQGVPWPSISGVTGFDPSTQAFQDSDSQISGTDSQPGCSSWSTPGRGPSDSVNLIPSKKYVPDPCRYDERRNFRLFCSICGRMFAFRSLLERHLRTHTGERPYVCPVCHRGFTQVGNLNSHMKLHPNVATVPTSTSNSNSGDNLALGSAQPKLDVSDSSEPAAVKSQECQAVNLGKKRNEKKS